MEFLLVLVPLLVMVDPPAAVGVFLGLTEGYNRARRAAVALKGTAFAATVLIVFAWGGTSGLEYLGIDLYSVRIAGGTLLLMIGLRMLREGREIPRREVALPTGGAADPRDLHDPSFVPLGLPMLAGPGALSMVIVQSTNAGFNTVAAAVLAAMAITLLALLAATRLDRILGDTGQRVITRIMAMIVVTFSVQYILDGLLEWAALWP